MTGNLALENEDENLVIYQTVGEDSEVEIETNAEPVNEDIETEAVSHEAAVLHFVQPPSRMNESLLEKSERIREEIESVRKMGGVLESKELLRELQAVLTTRPPPPPVIKGSESKRGSSEPQLNSVVSPEEFQRLEARVTAVEKHVGASARSPSLTRSIVDSVQSTENIVRLLASDPEHLKSQIDRLVEVKPIKIDPQIEHLNWIYGRLKTLDEEIRLLPHFISRLQTLKSVHSESIYAVNAIKETDAAVARMQAEVKEWRTTLTTLEHKVDVFISQSDARISRISTAL